MSSRQPTVGLKIDLPAVAKAVGYKGVYSVDSKDALEKQLSIINSQLSINEYPVFLEICVRKGNRKDLGRPTTTPIQNKEALMNFLQKTSEECKQSFLDVISSNFCSFLSELSISEK